MKKTLIRAISFFLTLSLLTGLLIPFASAIEYEGVESMTVDATAALLIDLDTDQVLYEQAADEQRYPASITKIMTALLTLEAIGRGELDLNTEITVDAAALADITEDSSTANLQAGEKITVKNLLYCLLLASANEAANVLAMAVSGDIPTFVELMNQRAQELGMAGTHFVNPHGLHNADHYSTARDIYRMSKQAMTHATFREIVSTGRYTVPATNLSKARSLLNTNGLLTSAKHYGYTMDGTIGIKTGSTGEAGYCLVAAVQKKGHTLVSVVLGAQNPTDSRGNVQRKQFTESKRLLNWGFTNFSDATLLDAETYLQELPVRFSSEASHVVVRPTRSVQVMVPGTYDPERLELRLRFHRDVASAPIEAGDVLGTVTVIYAGEEYATVDMAAVSDVSFSPFMAFVSSVNTVLGNIYVRLLLLIALALVVVGLVRRFQERTKEERRAKRQLRQQEKIAFRQREASRPLSQLEFLRQQAQFLHKRWWLLQGAVLVLLWWLLQSAGTAYEVQRAMGTLAPLFVVLVLPELWKNRSSGALEIECTAYYSLRQIYAARMVLFGLVDLALLTLFFSAALLAGQATLRDLIINFLLPFLVTGCICLRTLSHRRDTVCYAALPLCLAWTAVWVLLILSDQVYRMISLPMWLGMLLLATVYFLYAIRKLQNTCETIWEVSPVWH
mgnify:FL=1